MNFKEAYLQEFEEELSDLEERGVPISRAYDLASVRAYSRLQEKLAEQTDLLRIQMKDVQDD